MCGVQGLPDLNQGMGKTRGKIIKFMNELLEMGVGGFRIDAAKHMWPTDLQSIFSNLNNLSTKAFPINSEPFIYQEVIDLGGEAIKKCVNPFESIIKFVSICFIRHSVSFSIFLQLTCRLVDVNKRKYQDRLCLFFI